MRISDWSSDVCSSDLLREEERCFDELSTNGSWVCLLLQLRPHHRRAIHHRLQLRLAMLAAVVFHPAAARAPQAFGVNITPRPADAPRDDLGGLDQTGRAHV